MSYHVPQIPPAHDKYPLQCDDGNLHSMDGCNAQCQVEEQFECVSFPDMPSRCFFRMCKSQRRGFWSYIDGHYKIGRQVGYACELPRPLAGLPPVETLKVERGSDVGVLQPSPSHFGAYENLSLWHSHLMGHVAGNYCWKMLPNMFYLHVFGSYIFDMSFGKRKMSISWLG